MLKIFKGLYKPLCNSNGTIYYEVIIKTLIVVVLLLTTIGFYNLFIKYQNVNYLNRRFVRAIELEGQINSNANSIFNKVKSQLKIESANYKISNVRYFNGTNKIQLRENFTITVTYIFEIELFNPVFAPTVKVPMKLESTLTGMSEVYWKP